MDFIMCFGIIFHLLSIVLPVSTLYINKTQLKWTLALKSCKDTGNSLYIIHNVDDFNNVTRLLDVEEGTSFWIGGKERRKFFFWNDDKSKLVEDAVGCFNSSFAIKQDFVENQPSLCMSYCKNHRDMPYAALSGRQCICYPNLLATTATQVIDRHCNTLCPGDDNYICGSLNATVTTVYRANDSIKWKLFEPSNAHVREDCVLVTKDHGNQYTWFHDRCRNKNKYICRIFDETICQFKRKTKSPCLYMSPEQATWFEAVRKCANMGGHLVGKDIVYETDMIFNGAFFWTSLTRVRQRWLNSKVVSDLLPRSEEVEPRRTGCLTITKEDGKWNIQPGSCNKTLPFLCTKEEQPPSDVILRSAESLLGSTSFLFEAAVGISIAGVVIVVSLLMAVYFVNYRKRRKQIKLREEHFYFILEKEGVYNTISLNTSRPEEQVQISQNNVLVPSTTETYYDCLAFEGTIKYSERLRSITGTSEVGYRVYNRISDITKEYDVLQFNKKPCSQLSGNYYTFSREKNNAASKIDHFDDSMIQTDYTTSNDIQ